MTTVEDKADELPVATLDNSLQGHFNQYIQKVRGGDIGPLPAVIILILASTFFGIMRPRFFSNFNFANIFQQGAAVTVIAMGLVFVLLLGEIDLSAGFTSGVAAAVMCVLLTNHHVAWYWAVLAAIATGFAIGTVIGLLVAKLRIPSFVVTLAAFLALQGVQLKLLNNGNSISVFDSTIRAINSNSMSPFVGWLMWAAGILGYLGVQLWRVRSRASKGLVTAPISLIAFKVISLAIITGAAVYALNSERSLNPVLHSLKGVPIVVPIVFVIFLILNFVLSKTRYGRHIYAVGGSTEGARRAGIRVDSIRISVFMICSSMAAVAGILAVSRQTGVDSNTGGSDVLLFAVGAAVIGGTSLFGGKGRVLDAVLGGAVIAVISNGMDALNLAASIKYIVTGLVLLAAASIDAISRRKASASGR